MSSIGRIKSVQFYAGVRLNGKVLTHVENNLPRLGTASNKPTEVVITETENGILISNGNEAALGSWNNVQSVLYDITPETKKAK
jgi:hypothetical protein